VPVGGKFKPLFFVLSTRRYYHGFHGSVRIRPVFSDTCFESINTSKKILVSLFLSLVKHISLSQLGFSIDVFYNQIFSNQSQICLIFDNIRSELALASLDRNQRSMFVI